MAPMAVKERTTGKHVGFGKVILFGEHFVVHGARAVVAGISEYTSCDLELTRGVPGVRVEDKRPAVPGYITEKRAEQQKAHELVLRHLNIDTTKDGLLIRLAGPLVPSSGIGASASDVVALSRALSELYDLKLSEAQVNESAFIGEGGYHGTPSGVDNTAATYGGLLSFRREHGKAIFEPIHSPTPLYLIVIGTGITASTTKVVADVRTLKAKSPVFFKHLMAQYKRVSDKAVTALRDGNLEKVGAMMDANHGLCHQLGISCHELDTIVGHCREYGALGAKLSGTGRGGIVVALAATSAARDVIAEQLRLSCPEAKFIWKYTVSNQPRTQAKL